MELQKREDETLKEYKIRLFRNRKLYNLTNEEIADLLNSESGENKSSDAYRKWFRPYSEGFNDGYQDALSEISDNGQSDAISKIEEAKEEYIRERYKLQATKNEQLKTLRIHSRFELFYENVRNAIETLDVPDFVYSNNLYLDENKEYVLAISDIHYNSHFVGMNNKYSREICIQRFEKMLCEVNKEIIKNKINKIKVLNLGDTIQGMLRISDLTLNETSVVMSVVEISRILANFLNELSINCDVEYYHVPMSNHTQIRPLSTKASEIATEDMELIIINYVYDLLVNNPRVKIHKDYETDFLAFDIFNTKCIAIHGHQVKNTETILKDLSVQHRIFYDICFMGHKHTAKTLSVSEGVSNDVTLLMSPSFIGSCPYADSLRVGSKASVRLYEFNDIHGHIGTKNIILN